MINASQNRIKESELFALVKREMENHPENGPLYTVNSDKDPIFIEGDEDLWEVKNLSVSNRRFLLLADRYDKKEE